MSSRVEPFAEETDASCDLNKEESKGICDSKDG